MELRALMNAVTFGLHLGTYAVPLIEVVPIQLLTDTISLLVKKHLPKPKRLSQGSESVVNTSKQLCIYTALKIVSLTTALQQVFDNPYSGCFIVAVSTKPRS